MFKLFLILFGAAAGAAGATSWLLSEPTVPGSVATPPVPESLRARWEDLKTQLRVAVDDGRRAQAQTEERLRSELDAYRRGATPPAS